MHTRMIRSFLRDLAHVVSASACVAALTQRADGQVTETWRREEPTGPITVYQLANSVVLTDGSIVHAGTRSNPSPGVVKDVLLVRYAANGTTLWSRTFSPSGSSDTAIDLALDPSSGDLVLAGTTRAGGATNDDMRLSRFDAQGAPLWTTTYSTTTDDTPRFVRCDASGSIWVLGRSLQVPPQLLATFLLGFTSGGAQFAAVPLTPSGGEFGMDVHPAGGIAVMLEIAGPLATRRIETSRIDAAGNVLWTRSRPSGGSDFFFRTGRRLVCDAAGNTFVCGNTGTFQPFIVKYDAAGTEIWARAHDDGMNYHHWPVAIAVDAQGASVVVGISEEITISEFGFAMRCDASGNVSWHHDDASASPLPRTNYTDVAIDAHGDAVVVGVCSTPTGTQGVLARYGRDGTRRDFSILQWPPYSRLWECLRTGDGDLYVNGLVGTNIVTARFHEQGVAFCVGDGSAGACPCGNMSPTYEQSGCRYNASGSSRLAEEGIARIGADSIVLALRGAPADGPVIFVQGDQRANGGAGLLYGDGLLCVGGNVTRLGTRNAINGVARLGASGPHVSALGHVTAPGVYTYQAIHRSQASFCTPSAMGTSNGLELTWSP